MIACGEGLASCAEVTEAITHVLAPIGEEAVSRDDEVAPESHQLFIPESELLVDRAPILVGELFEQAVPLLQYARVLGECTQIRRIDGRENDIEVATTQRRTARDQLDILGREQDDTHGADEVQRADGPAVAPVSLGYRHRRWVQAQDDFSGTVGVACVEVSGHTSVRVQTKFACALTMDQMPLCRGAERASRCEEVQCFDQTGLA
ncbi:hypothetical protein HRbin27_01947 [bacterium HR27]|nr:hypothetical protein HRbin27_01947 [bacterium HR27]